MIDLHSGPKPENLIRNCEFKFKCPKRWDDYHSSPQARDRDKIRQDILQSFGWKIYRIWSTDWFSDPLKETDKMLAGLQQVGGISNQRSQRQSQSVNDGYEEQSAATAEQYLEIEARIEPPMPNVFVDELSGTRRQVDLLMAQFITTRLILKHSMYGMTIHLTAG